MAIRSNIFVITCFGALLFSYLADAKQRSEDQCPLSAFVTADNDIRFEGDTRPKGSKAIVPESVAHKIRSLVASDIASLDIELRKTHLGKHCSQFGRIYALEAGPEKTLYVAGRNLPFGFQANYLILFDNKSGAITANPPSIHMKWMNGMDPDDFLFEFPLVRFWQNGGDNYLIASEFAHNGSVYNAMIDRYFEIGHDLSFTQVMAVEARAVVPFSGALARRDVAFVNSNRVEMLVTESVDGGVYRGVGLVDLERSGANKPFAVVEQRIERGYEKWDGALVSFCGSVGDDDFQTRGCDFYY